MPRRQSPQGDPDPLRLGLGPLRERSLLSVILSVPRVFAIFSEIPFPGCSRLIQLYLMLPWKPFAGQMLVRAGL